MIWNFKDPSKLHGERRRAELALSYLQPHSNDMILDVGCGECYPMSFILNHCPQVIGVDISLQKLKEGKRRIGKADVIRASSEKLPFRPQVFDRITCLELLEHLEDPSRTLNEIGFALRNEGTLIISVPYKERIVRVQCIHCGKFSPLYGHIHSFDNGSLRALLPKHYVVLRRGVFCTPLSSYLIFESLPLKIWEIIDGFTKLLPGMKPSWLLNKVTRKPVPAT